MMSAPPHRCLRGYSLDPGFSTRLDTAGINEVVYRVPFEPLQRAFIFDIGGPHTFRTIYMDGRSHPTNLTPTYYGHSIGWWDGDSMVVDTVGYNEGF